MVKFPNPDAFEIHFAQAQHGQQLGDVYEAARAAGVLPGTIRVWVTRNKIEPVIRHPQAGDIFHLPTVRAAAAAGRKYTPTAPAANSRGQHTRRTAA